MDLTRLGVAFLLLLGACASLPENFAMYPQALDGNKNVPHDTAVVLVGNGGAATIGYLQFAHSSLPAINAYNLNLTANDIAAIPIPVGIKALSLHRYSLANRPGFYLPNGMAVGYSHVDSRAVDITTPGLYYVATVFPGMPKGHTAAPSPAILAHLKKTRPQLLHLKPINFDWPK